MVPDTLAAIKRLDRTFNARDLVTVRGDFPSIHKLPLHELFYTAPSYLAAPRLFGSRLISVPAACPANRIS
jgi:hypothetical protein